MTSDASWSPKIRQIGEIEFPDHTFLIQSDQCFFFGEYTPTGNTGRAAWSISEANQKIANLKKSPLKRGTGEWFHKERTIQDLGAIIRANIKPEYLPSMIFVPIPPSKPKTHPEHDSRMLDVARAIGNDANVVELLTTASEREAASQSSARRSVKDLENNLEFAHGLIPADTESTIVLLDDVITTGATYCACRNLIAQYLPNSPIVGLFVARRVPLPTV